MPEVFRFYGFRFFFFSREHEPMHVHVEGKGGVAKFDYDEILDKFELDYSHGLKPAELKRISRIINDNANTVKIVWNWHFGAESNEDEYDEYYEDLPW
jgi:hypothetical protein